MQVYCTGRKINSSTGGSLIKRTVQSSVDYTIDRLKKIREMTPVKNV